MDPRSSEKKTTIIVPKKYEAGMSIMIGRKKLLNPDTVRTENPETRT
jgi:hypothetical protein